MSNPNPALVTQRAAQRLPRLALLLLCAAYVVPGLFGRDPWKAADITAFGYMSNLAQGPASWLAPTIAGLPADAALLPYWYGALFVKALGPWIGGAAAARIPFALLLIAVLVLTWYSSYHLARSDSAQPLPFAFGGEANPVDYARAIADGALLALIATLGLLQLGHETTPELAQLASVSLLLYALSACQTRGRKPVLAILVALPALAASGAPSIALALGVLGTLVCVRSSHAPARRFGGWVAAATVIALAVATLLGAWGWRVTATSSWSGVWTLVRQLAWFTWPAWLLASWTLWRWHRQLRNRHIVVPLICVAVSFAACIAMGGSDRALMLGLPALAVLASFALPTLQRSTSAAIDWFSVFFFSICAVVIWVVYASLQTGVPKQPAANVARLAPGFEPSFAPATLMLATAGTVAWLWLVRWRTGRNRHPLWKSMVLPASGVVVCWLLLMTLWLPLLDYARSYRPLLQRLAPHLPRDACLAAPSLPRAELAALEHLAGFRVDAVTPPELATCEILLMLQSRRQPPAEVPGWVFVARESRPTDRDETTAVYRRATPAPAPGGRH